QIAFAVYPAVWSFYGIERFGWGPTLIGVSLACYGIMLAFVQGWFIRFILKYLTEKQTVIFGFFFEIVGFVGYGIIKEEIYAFILIPFGALGAVGIPALQGIMSRIAAPNQQGELQGLLTSLTSLAFIVSPLIMTGIFYMFVDPEFPIYLPGAPFLFSALVAIVCFGLIQFVKESDYGGEKKFYFSLK
ncbi:MAG: tetracycline resistance MFS efflux pump, partial [Paracoccaceae bacterium]|nr:tetracycline resistance MFS efflux pump [Paracoccaceae bacterium]